MKIEAAIEAGIGLHFLTNLAFAIFPIGQVEALHAIQPLIELLKQFGGLGLALWLVWYHTTKSIPNAQKESREERAQDREDHKAELIRQDEQHQIEMKNLQETFKEALQAVVCKFK